MSEQYTIYNDHTLMTEFKNKTTISYTYDSTVKITRLFNFMSKEVSISEQHLTYGNNNLDTKADFRTKNFSDFESYAELRFMYDKLKELGGTPPSEDEVFNKNHVSKTGNTKPSLGNPNGSG